MRCPSLNKANGATSHVSCVSTLTFLLVLMDFWRDLVLCFFLSSTLPETNIAPENRPAQKEISFSDHSFSRAICQFQGL